MQTFPLIILLTAGIAHGMFLRNSQDKPEAKVAHLCQDIEESVTKASQDAEMVFATLFTYDGQLDANLKKEIGTLNKTLASLLAMQATYDTDLDSARTKLSNVGASAHHSQEMASKYETGITETRSKYDGLQDNVRMLVALLKNAQVTPQGALVTPEVPDANGEPARVYKAIRRLLVDNVALQKSHPSVFEAFFAPSAGRASHFAVVRMTPGLLEDAIDVLSAVNVRLQSVESRSLLQFNSMHRRFEEDAVAAEARAQAQQGVEAENEQKAAELTFSINFTRAVMKIDQNFVQTIKAHVRANSDMVYGIRDLRQAQLQMLRHLTGILNAAPSIAPGGFSFLETRAVSQASSSDANFLGAVESEALTAIHNNGDTHAILMRMQAVLDNSEPVSANSVRETMVGFEEVLRSVEAQQSSSDEAKRRCESQKVHAKEQGEGVNANLALMSAAHDHATKAIKAAQKNVLGINKKAKALGKSSKDFSHFSTQALKSLEAQSNDRKIIMMAVQKASEVLSLLSPESESLRKSAVNLMQTLTDDISSQEAKEKDYRMQQDRFRSEFLGYIQDYQQLLDQRRRHYESSIGVLELHLSELASDLMAQRQAAATGHEISEQSTGLCESVLRFHDKHTKTREELSKTLRSLLPSMSTTLSDGVIASHSDA